MWVWPLLHYVLFGDDLLWVSTLHAQHYSMNFSARSVALQQYLLSEPQKSLAYNKQQAYYFAQCAAPTWGH